MSCPQCGTATARALCFDCFLGRPFLRNAECPLCGDVRPVVRQYLQGPACDSCHVERSLQLANARAAFVSLLIDRALQVGRAYLDALEKTLEVYEPPRMTEIGRNIFDAWPPRN